MDGDVLTSERLDDEVRNHPAVVGLHARPVGVENAGDLHGHSRRPRVIGKQRLGETLAFVVARARAQRVDVAEVVFRLRVNVRIAVDLRG